MYKNTIANGRTIKKVSVSFMLHFYEQKYGYNFTPSDMAKIDFVLAHEKFISDWNFETEKSFTIYISKCINS